MSLPDTLTISPSVLYFGTPVALVGTADSHANANISPVSSLWALGETIVLGLGTTGCALENIHKTEECTINLPSADLWPKIEAIARTTGSSPVPPKKAAIGYIHHPDKFALGGFTPVSSETVPAPRIAECPLQLECRLSALHGDKVRGFVLVDLEVTRVHAHRDIVVEGTRHIDTSRGHPLFFVFREYFGDARPLGRNFRVGR
ncbi:flavin reductase family protein [Gluconobacter cerinus]|uniref:flavin reductase family protein n=1 Tax=Gluconobacter cerinus TaxID=38307 RepID=UPI003AB45DAB